jgi:hypothetical protein
LSAKPFGLILWHSEQPFDVSIAERASEVKPVKMNGVEVLSVDVTSGKFRIKYKQQELEIGTSTDTVIKKGKDEAELGTVVVAGAKLNLEVLNGVAVSITSKK